MPMALIAGLLAPVVVAPSALAANGTGEYGTWVSADATKRSGEFYLGSPGSGFESPAATWTTTASGVDFASGSSTWLGLNTPFGAQYGSSQGRAYMLAKLSSKNPSWTITYNFALPTQAGNWGFALGDVDADKVKISATDNQGDAVDVATWFEGVFNYANGPDLPMWKAKTGELIGNGSDTSGASGWFVPKQRIKTLSLTFTTLVGFPSVQTWFATDVPQELPKPVEEIIPEAIAPVGTTVIVEETVTTNAGKDVRVKVTCTKPRTRAKVSSTRKGVTARNAAKPCKVRERPKSGRVTLTTYGIPTTVTVTLTAKAAKAQGFPAYRYTKKYSVKKPKPSK